MKTNILAVDPLEQSSSRNLELLKILNENKFVDVTIVTESEEFQAHKVILSSVSPVLKRIFDRNNQQHPLLYMRATKSQHIKALIDFIYKGQAHVETNSIKSFIDLAKELQIHGLYEQKPSQEESKDEKLPPTKKSIRSKTVDKSEALLHEFESRTDEDLLPITADDEFRTRNSKNKDIKNDNVFANNRLGYQKKKEMESKARAELFAEEYFVNYEKEVDEIIINSGRHDYYYCKLCSKSFANKSQACEHAEIHLSDEGTRFSWTCVCGDEFNSKCKVRRHYPCSLVLRNMDHNVESK